MSTNEEFFSRIRLHEPTDEFYKAAITSGKILYYGYRVDYEQINGKHSRYELIGSIDRKEDGFISSSIT